MRFFCMKCGKKIVIYQEIGDQSHLNDFKCECGFIMPIKQILEVNHKK